MNLNKQDCQLIGEIEEAMLPGKTCLFPMAFFLHP